MASTTFNIRVSKRKWLTISNVYIPPNRASEEETMVTDHIPTGVGCFIAGDLNGHSSLWDPVQPTDSRGTRIEEWMNDTNLVCLNSGAATRHNRSTGNPSSPDIFLAPTTWTNRLRWQTVEDIGGSDHLPILIQAFCRTQRLAAPARRQRWKRNHDMSEFRASLEHKLEDAKLQVDTLESRQQFSKSERDTNRTSRRLKSAMSADDASAQDFTMLKLEKAIASMRSRGAAGPDEITPAFIKAFGHNAKYALLALSMTRGTTQLSRKDGEMPRSSTCSRLERTRRQSPRIDQSI